MAIGVILVDALDKQVFRSLVALWRLRKCPQTLQISIRELNDVDRVQLHSIVKLMPELRWQTE